MIIKALCEHYQRLLDDEHSGISRPGYSKARVSFAAELSPTGELVNIIDLREQKGNKLVSRDLIVPEQVKRSSGVKANFLCDNCTYVLGLNQKGKKKAERIKEEFTAFYDLHREILGEVNDIGAQAVLAFLENWDYRKAEAHFKIIPHLDDLQKGENIMFRLQGDQCFIHERNAVASAWSEYCSVKDSTVLGQCLVSGEILPIARLHPSIKGVTGAQSSGASLVSYNLDAFTSYGKTQSYNASISEDAAFAYTTALNYMLSNLKHRIRIGDTTTVFWAERSTNGLEEDLLGALFFPENAENEENEKEGGSDNRIVRDPQTIQLLKDIFSRIRSGRPVLEELAIVDPNVNFYILGLAPNASRLSVRYWHVDQYGNFLNKISQHYRDLEIVRNEKYDPEFISISRILKETAPLGDTKRIPPLLGGILMRAVLTGMPYPQALFNVILSRIRADHKVNYVRAAMIKAILTRHYRYYKKHDEVTIKMSIDEQNTNTAYRMGRLFALLEKAQEDANPGLNATIKDRYFGAASSTPASVFPILLRLAQHHIAKGEYGRLIDRQIQDVLSEVKSFPQYLSLEDQGLFVLGYYHQRQALFTKKEKGAE
ncbi:MAG: type I-C CRISPR-associated protein Cas8c/Csd1 [Firmicutes bacterium]|nr:type I-C CRISPR-associated protein Cas8c/Csd1 [Bacillota bacterium]